MASASVGLPARSPPPVRAATSMVLIILANSLPRLASTTAFLCLVVAHLEWPLMSALSFTISTNNPCTRRSPVSSGWNDVASTGPLRTATTLPAAGPPGGTRRAPRPPSPALSTHGAPDEHGVDLADARRGRGRSRTSRPAGRRRCGARRCRARRACAGPAARRAPSPASRIIPAHEPYAGRPACSGLLQRVEQLEQLEQHGDRRGLATGQHDPVEAVEVLGTTYDAGLGRRRRSAARCSRTSPCRAEHPDARSAHAPTSRGWRAGRRRRASRRPRRPSPRRGRG